MRALVLIGLFGVMQGAAVARAQPAAPPDAVDLVVAADSENAEALAGVIAELLTGLGVTTRARVVDGIDPRDVVTPPETPEPALARVWIAAQPPSAVLYLADAPWERVLVRRVPIEALDVAAREQLAQIVLTAVEALMSGASIGLTRDEAEAELLPRSAPEPEPRPAPTPPARVPREPSAGVALEVWLGGGLPIWSDGPRVGGAIFARAALVPEVGRIRPITSVELRVRPAQTVDTGDVAISIAAVTARIEGGADVLLDPDTTLRGGIGIALDVTSVDPHAASDGVTPTAARDDLTALVALSVGLTRRLDEWVWASVGTSIDVDLVDTQYVVLASGRQVVVLDPWSVRPWPWLAVGGRFR